MSTRRVLVGVLAALLFLPALEGAASAGPDVPQHRAMTARASLITVVGPGRLLFSPNRDGRRDTARRTFSLTRPARVVVRVVGRGRLVRGPVRLGALRAGRHAWRWDGRGNGGRVVDDGGYTIVLEARRAGRTSRVTARAIVDTTLGRGSLVSTRPAVYPAATQVSDHLELAYLQPGWDEAAEFLPSVFRAVLVISNARGDVVRRRTVSDANTPVFDWFATRNDGSPMPAGRYVARVLVFDPAGNRQVFAQPVTVSHQQLLEEVWTGPATPAGQVATYRPYYGGCNDCAACAPVASERFDGGLSFRECDFEHADTTGFLASDVPFDEAPVDTFRFTSTGGPTEPGSSDTGNLNGTPTAEGDSSTTSDWQPVSLMTYPHLPTQDRPVSWRFWTSDDEAYDVATFAVEYRHWVPAS